MMTCPSCKASDGVQIEEDPLGQSHWAGRCDPCGHSWTFSDDV